MAEMKSLLDGVIEREIQSIESMESGSEERVSAINELATLYKLRIEEIKAETDAKEKDERREMDSNKCKQELNDKLADRTREEELQKRQFRDQLIDRCVKAGVDVAGLVLPLMFYGIWMNRGFKFEETGSFTSTTFKNLLNRFRPTK